MYNLGYISNKILHSNWKQIHMQSFNYSVMGSGLTLIEPDRETKLQSNFFFHQNGARNDNSLTI